MSEFVIARIDVPEGGNAKFEHWLLEEHLPSVGDVGGLQETALVYQSKLVETAIRRYPPRPAYTIFYPVAAHATVHELMQDGQFTNWWRRAITARFNLVSAHDWVACRRIHGPDEPLRGSRALLTQVHVAAGHEAGWARWYRERHVPDAKAVPGMFEGPMWQFESFDVNTDEWHVAPRPRFTHLLPISEGVDWLDTTASPEFLALASDTQSVWGGAVEHVVSNLSERIA